MHIFTLDDLRELANPREGWCVSIYMPAVIKGQQVRQNPIRYKNLLDQARDELARGGMEATEVESFFAPAEDLLRNEIFWQEQEKSLAVLISDDFFRYFQLPELIEEQVLVNRRFYLKPMLPLLYSNEEFYILALSQKQVRLLKATEFEVEEEEVSGLPKNMQDALGYDDLQANLQWQTGTGQVDQSGERRAMFHGHGEGRDNRKDFLLNYMRVINKAITGYLKDSETPLVLACVEYLQPIYKEANTYLHLSDEVIPGSPEGVRDRALRDQAWKLLKHIYQTSKQNHKERYHMLAGRKDPLAVKDVADIVKAAPYGRVEVLFIDKNAKRWGFFDEKNMEVHLDKQQRPGNEDLLDYAAIETLLNGGEVITVDPQEMPEQGSPAAAILRY
jgi:hypothetical protein